MNCSDCTPGNWLPGSPKGTEEDGAYLAKGPNQEDTNEKAVFLLTDIFGLISNPKIIADSLAELTGFDVWVPDLFNGHPSVALDVMDCLSPRRPGDNVGFWKSVKFYWTVLTYIFGIIASRPGVVDPRAKEVSPFVLHTENLAPPALKQDQGQTQLREYWCSWYCFSRAITIRITQLDPITSIVIAHPTPSTLADIKAIHDFAFSKELGLQSEAHFESRTPELRYEFVDYPSTVHGFACRLAREHLLSAEGQEKALEQAAKWFQSTL